MKDKKDLIHYFYFLKIILFSVMGIITIFLLSHIVFLNNSINIWQIILIIFFLILIIGTTIFVFGLSRKVKKYSMVTQKTLMTALYTSMPQMEIIISFFISLLNIAQSDSNEKNPLLDKYKNIKENIARVKKYIKALHEHQLRIKEKKNIYEQELVFLEEEIRIINNGLYDISIGMIANIEEFSHIYLKNKNTLAKLIEGMAYIIYYLQNIIPIISDLSLGSSNFSKSVMIDVINRFQDIARFSNEINEDVQLIVNSLMDETKKDSLAYIIRQARVVVEDFEKFYANMENLRVISNDFINKTAQKLNNIAQIANAIEKIASTVKVISLNVNIEAAKTTSADAKGFLVLGKDLREFADKTMRFAQDVRSKVKDAIVSTHNLGVSYTDNLKTVNIYVEDIKKSLESFESVIGESFSKIKGVVTTLQNFSRQIDADIKTIIGKLQTYDITTQEVEHVSQFIEKIFRLFDTFQQDIHIDEVLSETKKTEIKESILQNVKSVITTANEHDILRKYSEIFNIKIQNNEHLDHKNEEENIILF